MNIVSLKKGQKKYNREQTLNVKDQLKQTIFKPLTPFYKIVWAFLEIEK